VGDFAEEDHSIAADHAEQAGHDCKEFGQVGRLEGAVGHMAAEVAGRFEEHSWDGSSVLAMGQLEDHGASVVDDVEQDLDVVDHVAEDQGHADVEEDHAVEDYVVEGHVAADQDHVVDCVDHFAIADHRSWDLDDPEDQELEGLCMDPTAVGHLDHCIEE
jgi:hypothetical protein